MGSRMISLKKGSERDLFWNFARAEFEIPKHGVRHTQPAISRELKDRILRDERATFTEQDWEALRRAVLSTRSSLVQPLIDLGTEWFLGALPSNAWGEVRVMNLHIFTDIAPTRRLSELATALDSGAVPRVWNPSNYPDLRSSFDLSMMHGDPIVVAERPTGPYTLVEGTTRMCVLLSRRSRGEVEVTRIPMLLGVCPRLGEWEFY
jgi:hypothetical protein